MISSKSYDDGKQEQQMQMCGIPQIYTKIETFYGTLTKSVNGGNHSILFYPWSTSFP